MKALVAGATLLFPLLVAPSLPALQEATPPPPSPGRPARAELEGRSVPLSVVLGPRGPLVTLAPLVGLLGGRLERGPGPAWTLTLNEVPIVLGPDSTAVTRGTEILHLSQAPSANETGPLVPLDLLEGTYGALAGFRFQWEPATDRLVIRRPARTDLPVTLDLVHLQGVTTLVLQFPEQPRYRVEDRPGGVDVHFTDADLVAQGTGWGTVRDPLVRRVAVAGERVHIDLGPGVQTATYTLERPFRLVFDLHRPTTTVPAPPVESLGGHGAREKGIRTIVLDPGHGGGETGAIGPSGTLEKDLTLALARALKHKLESQMPVKVVLTRDEDAPLPLETRTAVANQNQADLFLSIHLNSAAGSGARGAETYFLSLTASDARAEQSAQAENRPAEGDLASYDLQLILWDLAQSRHLAESQTVARLIQEELNQALGLRDRGVKQAPFRVLMGAAMPAVLVELGFLSNPEEESRLADAAYRAGLVDALARAVARYRAQVAPRPDGSGESARGGPAEAGGVPAP